jgi:hypothetical protein
VVTCAMDASFSDGSTPSPWHTDAVRGVHSITHPSHSHSTVKSTAVDPKPAFEAEVASLLTHRWREMDSNLYGAFPVKSYFGLLPVLCSGAEGPFFIPSPTIRFRSARNGVKGAKR